MSRCLLHVLQLRPVLQRRGDEGRPHRVRRVAPWQADRGGVLPHHAVDRVRVELAGRVMRLGVAAQRPEQRSRMVVAVSRQLQVGPDALRRLRD